MTPIEHRVFVDANDRDEEGRIRVGKSPRVVDSRGEPVAPQQGLLVEAYDNAITVPGALEFVEDHWVVNAEWERVIHSD